MRQLRGWEVREQDLCDNVRLVHQGEVSDGDGLQCGLSQLHERQLPDGVGGHSVRSVRRGTIPVEHGAVDLRRVHTRDVPGDGGRIRVLALPAWMGGQRHECDGVHGVRGGEVAEPVGAAGVRDVRQGQVPVEDQLKRLPGLRGGEVQRVGGERVGRAESDPELHELQRGDVCGHDRVQRVLPVCGGQLSERHRRLGVQGVRLGVECGPGPDGVLALCGGEVSGVGCGVSGVPGEHVPARAGQDVLRAVPQREVRVRERQRVPLGLRRVLAGEVRGVRDAQVRVLRGRDLPDAVLRLVVRQVQCGGVHVGRGLAAGVPPVRAGQVSEPNGGDGVPGVQDVRCGQLSMAGVQRDHGHHGVPGLQDGRGVHGGRLDHDGASVRRDNRFAVRAAGDMPEPAVQRLRRARLAGLLPVPVRRGAVSVGLRCRRVGQDVQAVSGGGGRAQRRAVRDVRDARGALLSGQDVVRMQGARCGQSERGLCLPRGVRLRWIRCWAVRGVRRGHVQRWGRPGSVPMV